MNKQHQGIDMKCLHCLLKRVLFTLICFVLGAMAVQAEEMPADIDPTSHARLPYIKRADLSKEDQAIYDMLPGRMDDGRVAGPLAWPAYNIGVAKALVDLNRASRGSSELTPYQQVLAVIVACRETNFSQEWNANMHSAEEAGIPESIIDVVLHRKSLQGVPEKDAVIIHFGRQLFDDKKVDSETFAKAKELLGDKGVMDMVAVMSSYAVSGFFAIAVDEHMADGSDLE